MVTFRNNNNTRRPPFRSNNNRRPPFRRNNEEGSKYKSNFSSSDNFQRKVPGRNNHNASKLIEKYNDLAREALASEDKILSENYFQHADHFMRVLNEQEKIQQSKIIDKPLKTVDEKVESKEKMNEKPPEIVDDKKNETEKKIATVTSQ